MEGMPDSTGRVAVFARTRPLSAQECGDFVAVEMSPDSGQVSVVNDTSAVTSVLEGVVNPHHKASAEEDMHSTQEKVYRFDGAFPPETGQKDVFQSVGLPVLVDTMKGFNGTIMAYGQTGSGKTHSLLNADNDTELVGLLPRLVATLYVHARMDRKHRYTMEAAAFQVYNEQVDDLLAEDVAGGKGQNLTVSQGEVHGLTWQECGSPPDMIQAFQKARSGLHYAETKMNKASSRSHSIFQIKITRRKRRKLSSEGLGGKAGAKVKVVCGRLSVVDLAGSERVKKSGVTGSSFKEATNINRSLLELGNVIQALASKSPHVPFRNSKLTRILQGSVGGNCKTALLVCISPAQRNYSETISTLEFASRAMNVQVHAKVNEHMIEIDPEKLAADLNQEEDLPVMDEEMMKTYKENQEALARARESTQEKELQVQNLSKRIDKIQADFTQAREAAKNSMKDKEAAEEQTKKLVESLESTKKQHLEEKRKFEEGQKKLEIQIGRTEKQLRETTDKYEAAQVEIKSQRTKLASLSKRLIEVEQSSLEKEKLASKRINDLKTSKQVETQRLQTEIVALGEEKQQLQTHLTKLKTDIIQKETLKDELKTAMEELQQSNAHKQQQLDDSKTRYHNEIAAASSQIEALKADVLQKARQCEQEQRAIEEGRQAMAAAQRHAEDLERRVLDLSTDANGKSQVIANLQAQVSSLKQSTEQEHSLFEAAQHRAQQLQEETESLKHSVAEMNQEKQRILLDHERALAQRKQAQASELERANKHAAEAVHALEIRAENDLNKLRVKLEQAHREQEELQLRGAEAVEQAKQELLSEIERIELEKQELIKQKARQKLEHKVHERRLSTSYQAAGKAVQAQLRKKDEQMAALQARFDARESRREDVLLIAKQKRALRQAERRTEMFKKELARKDLELENLKSTVRIFGTKNETSQTRKPQQQFQSRPSTAASRDREHRSINQSPSQNQMDFAAAETTRRHKGPRPLPTPGASR